MAKYSYLPEITVANPPVYPEFVPAPNQSWQYREDFDPSRSSVAGQWDHAGTNAQINVDTRPENGALESVSGKIGIFVAPLITTVATILLIASHAQSWYIDGSWYDWVEQNRATTQVIVQALSSFLGMLQAGTLRSLISYDGRRKLTRRPVTLGTLDTYNALSTSQISWSLPPLGIMTAMVIAFAAMVPGSVWSGALTPIAAVVQHPVSLSIAAPLYPNEWNNEYDGQQPTQTADGLFTFNAGQDRHAYFLDDGARAISVDGSSPVFRKGDYTNYTYHGRSYGVGAAVGINDTSLTAQAHLVNYTYFENGFHTSWTCAYNHSVNSSLISESDGGQIYIFKGRNSFDGSLDGGWFVADLSGWQHIAAASGDYIGNVSWLADPSVVSSYVVFIGMSDLYSAYTDLQCGAVVVPALFQVDVDTTNRAISVTPNLTAPAINIDPNGQGAAGGSGNIPAVLSSVGTTTYTSLFGNMLNQNVYSLNQSTPGLDNATLYTRATAAVLEVLSDQILFSNAGALLMIDQRGSLEDAAAHVSVLRIGQDVYIWVVVGVQAALLLALAAEAARTRLWRGLPRLDFDSVAGFAVAGSGAGSALSDRVRGIHLADGASWGEKPVDGGSAAEVKVMLRRGPTGLDLALVDQDTHTTVEVIR